jgi:predicted nucleic acid-binding protein
LIVADANVILYRILQNPRQPDARALARIDPIWTAPRLWRSEVRNALVKHVRANHINVANAEAAVQFAGACLLGGERPVPDRTVFHLAERSRCSAYDCEYVALAELLDVILVTEDQALLHAFPQRCRSIAQMI